MTSLILSGSVIVLAYRTFVRRVFVPERDRETPPFLVRLVNNKFYIDEIYSYVFEKPYGFLSDFLFNKVENSILNPVVDSVGTSASRLGDFVRRLQQGNISFYLFAMVAGILLFILFILIV
jgi:NADH-quinone oxidoreductase subunit L